MTSHASYEDDGHFSPDFDLGQIFIGREQQLDLFDLYLNRWKRLMAATPVSGDLVTIAPNPNNKIQGLVVLLYGRGGFGKSTLLNLQKDDRYAWLRKIASEEVVAVLRAVIPAANLVPSIDIIASGAKEGLNQAIKIGADQAKQLYAKLSDRLKEKLDDYLEPALKLGLSLGRDLSNFARNFPLLIFFDTYEEIDEGDPLLRRVMGATGVRVTM